jgi:haloalkane dehalogenase
MGASDKPPLAYRFEDHYHFLTRFINMLGLERIHLVMHDWGSALGFYYAMNHPETIRSMAWMEGLVKPWSRKSLKWQYRLGFGLLRMPLTGEVLVYGLNAFLNLIMPRLMIKKLSPEQWRHYKQPFRKITARKPMLVWPREIPINGRPARTYRILSEYSCWLQQTPIPKMMIYAMPGAIINQQALNWCLDHLKNLETACIGEGLHYLQEDHPQAIAQKLKDWIQKQNHS